VTRQMSSARMHIQSYPGQTILPGARSVVGHGLDFRRDKLGTLERVGAAGPGAVLLLPDPVLVLTEPGDVQHVLVRNPAGYTKGPKLVSDRGRRVFGGGLLTEHGAAHRRLRLLVQPAFHRSAASGLGPVLRAALETALEAWQPGAHDVHGDVMRGARLAIQRTLFGELPDAGAVDEAIAARRAFAQRWFTPIGPGRAVLASRANVRYWRSQARLERRVAELVDERLARPGAHNDLLAHLASSRDRLGNRLSRDELITEGLSLTVPGHETVGESLAWSLDLLARNPDEQEQARAAAAAGDASTLERIVDESLRLYPPTWVTVRVATKVDELPSGVRVAAGQRLSVSPWLLHRDPRWWPAPTRFDPGRFAPAANTDRPRRAYIPFGAGPRVCVGEQLARTELVEGLAAVLREWRLRPLAPPPRPDPGLTLAPRGGARLLLEKANGLR
jgi:cytochrome P450